MIKINWKEEVIKLVKEHFKSLGILYNENLDAYNCLIDFMNLQAKLIKPSPRIVLKSKELENRKISFEERKALNAIKIKIENGENITFHMSKKVLNPSHNDLLFNDWLIHHLHLSNTRTQQNQKFYDRTKNVLFATFIKTHAFFIDIIAHGKNGEPHVFAKKELLEIIYRNWPKLLENYEYKGFKLLHNPTNEEIEMSRRAGLMFGMTEISGKTFFNPGRGMATSGHNVHTVRRATEVMRHLHKTLIYIQNNLEDTKAELSQEVGYNITELGLCIKLIGEWPFFVVYEKNSKRIFRL
ncbi:MAG TPA: hypothetical protein VLB84_07255 [Bacteroidia bacterium]|nr:hypothetical protein [Bacteroidia bacterium]